MRNSISKTDILKARFLIWFWTPYCS